MKESIAAEGRPVAALVAVVRSFCREAAVYYRARQEVRIDDAEACEIADAAGTFFADVETAGAELLAEEPRWAA
ncbi:MAG: hypothetical protein ABFC89_12935 [Methanospirillum sp.]